MPCEIQVFQNLLDALQFIQGKVNDYFDRARGVTRLLVNLRLFFQIPLELGVRRELELYERLILAASRYFKIGGATAVVGLPRDVRF